MLDVRQQIVHSSIIKYQVSQNVQSIAHFDDCDSIPRKGFADFRFSRKVLLLQGTTTRSLKLGLERILIAFRNKKIPERKRHH